MILPYRLLSLKAEQKFNYQIHKCNLKTTVQETYLFP